MVKNWALNLNNRQQFKIVLFVIILQQSSFSKNTQKHVFCALSLNISYKIHFFFGEKFLVALDTYAKKK